MARLNSPLLAGVTGITMTLLLLVMSGVIVYYENQQVKVLGIAVANEKREAELIKVEIEELKILNEKVESKSLLLRIAVNHWRVGENEDAWSAWARAERIAPNDEEVAEVKGLLESD